jgi:hypothetical protein
MSTIVIQTLFRCESETSIHRCGDEGVHCDVIIAQTSDTWGHMCWACNEDSFLADCRQRTMLRCQINAMPRNNCLIMSQ